MLRLALLLRVTAFWIGTMLFSTAQTSLSETEFSPEDRKALELLGTNFWSSFKEGKLLDASKCLDEHSQRTLAIEYRSIIHGCYQNAGEDGLAEIYSIKGEFEDMMRERDPLKFFALVRTEKKGLIIQHLLLKQFVKGPKLVGITGKGDVAYLVWAHKNATEAEYTPDRLTAFRASRKNQSWTLELPPHFVDALHVFSQYFDFAHGIDELKQQEQGLPFNPFTK